MALGTILRTKFSGVLFFTRLGVLLPNMRSTLCAPLVHPTFCPRTPVLHPFRTPLVHWKPLPATFVRGRLICQHILHEGHPLHPPSTNMVAQVYMLCLFLPSLMASPTASLYQTARCCNPTSRVSMFKTCVRPHAKTRVENLGKWSVSGKSEKQPPKGA